MIGRFIIIILIATIISSCKDEYSTRSKISIVDSLYTLNPKFKKNDIRRYGVFPDSGIGIHPKLKKDKMEALLDVAESGIELKFPDGYYSRSLRINGRKNLKINFEDAYFNGPIEIIGSQQIILTGNLTSYSQFYIKESIDVSLDKLALMSDINKNSKRLRNSGCSIHAGTQNFKAKKITIHDLGSGPEYKYIKAAFSVHGHNNEPVNIVVDSVIVESSDRHGAYLTGDNITLRYLEINKFGAGTTDNMAPMEGGVDGEQYQLTGLWIKNAHSSEIEKAIIYTDSSSGSYSINCDIGEYFRPCVIDTLIIQGENNSLSKRILKRTGVVINTHL